MITRSIRFRMALWYAALLAGALSLFGAATYLGLERYLQKSLEESLIKQARSIGDVLLVNINQSGEDYQKVMHRLPPLIVKDAPE